MIKLVIALLGGILMGLSVAPVGAFYGAWIALVPLWVLLFYPQNETPKPSLKVNFQTRWKHNLLDNLKLFFNQKTLLAFLWGVGYHGLALFWITGIHPMTWMGVPWLVSLAIAIACWSLITFWGAVLVWTWGVGMSFFETLSIGKIVSDKNQLTGVDRALRILFGVALWCALETLWSHGPLWWSAIAYTQSPHNLILLQLGQLSGFATVTAAIVAINGIFGEIILIIIAKKPPRWVNFQLFLIPLSFVFSLHLLGFYLYNRPLNDLPSQAISMGIIQGNIPNQIKLYPQGLAKAIQGYTDGYQKLAESKVDVVLTPEVALPFYWEDIVNYSPFYQAVLKEKIPVLLGAFGRSNSDITNSLFAIDAEGKLVSRFDKVKLVPLGEYVPFRSIIGGLIKRLSPLEGQFTPGNPQQILMTPVGQAIAAICYESAFGETFRYQAVQGGEFIVTAANNAHYSHAMPAQHHAQDVMRAIETDRWLARATNTGYSAIINPQGRTIWLSKLDEYALHSGNIYRRQTKTLYVQWGDWLTSSLCLIAVGTVLWRHKF
jgi:apolipoprotein N-acyltransferase